MANNRPIRTPRSPRWRRGKFFPRRAPVRWIDCNSHQRDECGISPTNIACEPQASPRELLVGDLDFDWSDRNEVLVDRIVGTITFNVQSFATNNIPYPTIVRFGILATEETDRVYNPIDLFDPESLEEYQWMWLQQLSIPYNGENIDGDTTVRSDAIIDVPLDIHTRRKIGKKDSVVLYAQVVGNVTTAINFEGNYSYLLRAVIKS